MRNVLLTGASSGIGEATALHLAELGMRVFAGVRTEHDREVLLAKAAGTGLVHGLVFDVRDSAAIDAAVEEVSEIVGTDGLSGVVNIAGEGYPGPLEVVTLDELREQLEVNVVGQVAVTQATLPLLRQGNGRLVFVGSIGGKAAIQFAGPYHASKFAIEAIGDCLRQELQPDGIAVSVIEPGPISTGIWDKADERLDDVLTRSPRVDRYRDRLATFRETMHGADDGGGSPGDVAVAIEQALTATHPSARYPVGGSAKLATAIKPLIPDRLYDAVIRRATGG
jgi:NAD(P)-dependent dehydrogenase (short-subunit alcohol dehydrogenase family)